MFQEVPMSYMGILSLLCVTNIVMTGEIGLYIEYIYIYIINSSAGFGHIFYHSKSGKATRCPSSREMSSLTQKI